MPLFRTRTITPMRTKATTGAFNFNREHFQSNLNQATLTGKLDSATATEHMFRVEQLIAQNKHKEAQRFVDSINRSIGTGGEEKFK